MKETGVSAPNTNIGRKAIIVSLVNTDFSGVVLARDSACEVGYYFSTAQLVGVVRQMIMVWVQTVAKEQRRTIIADPVQLNDTMTNLTHHFISFCAETRRHEAVVFDGFNDQHGEAMEVTIKLVRTHLINFNNEP